MPRLIVLLALLALAATPLPAAPPLHPSPAFTPAGPAAAAGALVWLHGAYDTDTQPTTPTEPAWIARLAAAGYDIWRFDRTPGHDPLRPGGDALVAGLRALRAQGYRRIIVAGHSRGAWIALSALAVPDLADAVAAISPAAHGTGPARRAQAMADWHAMMDAATPGGPRFALVQLRDDPFDPDPAARRQAAQDATARAGLPFLGIYLPPAPTGHVGIYDPAFDKLFGEKLAAFLNPAAPPQAGRR
jgi:hypothetical protein